MTVAVAVVRKRERDVVEAFRRAGAISPARARSLDQLDLEETNTVRRLIRRAVVRASAPGRYYLDEPSYQALRALRRRFAIGILLLIICVLVVAGVAVSG